MVADGRPARNVGMRATTDEDDSKAMLRRMGQAGEGYYLTPEDAMRMESWDFETWRRTVPVRKWSGYDREAWATAATKECVQDMAAAETKVMQADSVFGKALRAAGRRQEPIMPAVADLGAMLEDMQEDDDEHAVEVYLRQSRGVELVPAGVEIPPTDVENYRPQTPLLARQRVAELQRHRDRDFTDSWANLRAVHGDRLPEAPVNVLPVNIQPKNEQVGRVVFDPSNAGGATSVNDMLPSPPCHLPRMQHAAAAMSRRGLGWRADDSDAFLLHPLKPESMPHCAYRDESGQMCALKRMGLGFTNAPAAQQDSMVASLRAYRRRLRRLGLHTAGTDPGFGEKWQYCTPGSGHELTAALGYVDDVFGLCTTHVASWFSFMHYLLHKRRWKTPLGTKALKTDPPAPVTEWIGYLYDVPAMQVALDEKRLTKMRADLEPFTALDDAEARAGRATVTVAALDHVMGVLEFGGNVILLGKAYFREIRELRRTAGPKARPSQAVRIGWAVCQAMQTWAALTEGITARSAFIGARRGDFPHEGWSDASFDDPGWCWHCMGVINYGSWPSTWKERMGHHSRFRDIWINELELWAVLLQVRMMAPRVRGMTYHLWCDNLGVVYMINKLGTRSERCSRLVAELIWIAVVYDIELAVRHVPTHENVLADAGTRQHDKEFRGLARQYLSDHPRDWLERERRRWPAQLPARPELLPLVPVVHAHVLDTMEVDEGELGRLLPEFMKLGAAPRRDTDVRADADALLQALGMQR